MTSLSNPVLEAFLSVLPEECQQRVQKKPPEIQEAMAQQWQEDFETDAGPDVLNLEALTRSQKMVASRMALRMVDDEDAQGPDACRVTMR
ncbi:hypothetical protein [Streptomyces lacrimifluminis]|uniref:hypothetical protein n=1 Tax=Streptomyces lacrimifluminis TaxID=1500077 RepID=UPI001666DFB3|nr:hypothetical protein [Streptomyces lacrimifluminis]